MSAHNVRGGNVMTTTITAAAAETQQSNRHGRGGGMVTATVGAALENFLRNKFGQNIFFVSSKL